MSAPNLFKVVLPTLMFLPWSLANAQIPTRIIVNESFERPSLSANCAIAGPGFAQIDQGSVQGWNTTAPSQAGLSCGPGTGSPIEIWANNFQSVAAYDGDQHAEVNAESIARLYQDVCLTPNESVDYEYYHRARSVSNESTRASLYDTTGALVFNGPVDAVSPIDGWVRHAGSLTNNAAAGGRQFSFESIAPPTSVGNFIDSISVDLRPIVEIQLNTMSPSSGPEDTVGTLEFSIIISGTMDNPAVFTLDLDGSSTATPQADFSILVGALVGRGDISAFNSSNGQIEVTLPAGEYDPNQTDNTLGQQGVITIPLSITPDALHEQSETIIYNLGAIQTGGGNTADKDLLVNDSTCNGSVVSQVTGTITDDDIAPLVPKQVPTLNPFGLLSLSFSMLILAGLKLRKRY